MRLDLSTETVPERDRFAVWHDTVFSTFGVRVEAPPDGRATFRGRLAVRTHGPLLRLSYASSETLAVRRRSEIVCRPMHRYWIRREATGGSVHRIAGREYASNRGDLLIDDADAGWEARPLAGIRFLAWHMPKGIIEPHLPAYTRPAVHLPAENGVKSLAGSYLAALNRTWDRIPVEAMPGVADTLARLIGVACGAAAEHHADAVRRGRLAEATAFINAHLAEPELSPAQVAAALRISVRALHLLFEPTGTSFSRHVLQRRLEECRAALLAHPVQPVTDIAFAWGFGTLSSFYRAFQATFGTSPGELRAAARGQASVG